MNGKTFGSVTVQIKCYNTYFLSFHPKWFAKLVFANILMLVWSSPKKTCNCKAFVPHSRPPTPYLAACPCHPAVLQLKPQQCTEHSHPIPWGIFLGWEGTTEFDNVELVLKDTIAECDLQREAGRVRWYVQESALSDKISHSCSISGGLASAFQLSSPPFHDGIL